MTEMLREPRRPGRARAGGVRRSLAGHAAAPSARPPRLLYVVTEDWYFLSHRLPMACAARDAGFEVHVATRVGAGRPRIEAEGFVLHELSWSRAERGAGALGAVMALRALYRRLDPDIVHHVALKPALLGSIAGLGLRPRPVVNSVAGLGFVFSSDRPLARALRPPFGRILASLMNRPLACALVQNPDDREALIGIGVNPQRIARIAGSGVETQRLTPLPEPGGPFTVALAARMLEIKGVREAVAAHRLLRERGREIRLLLAGDPDPANPSAIRTAEIEAWRAIPGLEWLGHVTDIRDVWAAAHVAILPSHGGEGLPKSLLEAAACGRPIVASDVPGCREIARPGVNALRVPPRDAHALADAIETLADAELRRRFAAAGRRIVVDAFSAERIGAETVALYGALLGTPQGSRADEHPNRVALPLASD